MRRSDYIKPVVETDPTLVKSTQEKNKDNLTILGDMEVRTPLVTEVPILKLRKWTPTQVPKEPEWAQVDHTTPLEKLIAVKPTLRTDGIEKWLRANIHRTERPMQYIGHEANTMDPKEFEEADLRILVTRLSPYDAVGGSMTHGAIAQFTRKFSQDLGIKVYTDFAFMPVSAEDSRYFTSERNPREIARK